MKQKRISKDQYYLGIAEEVSRRSTCFRRSIGAIIIRDDQIISAGYVGAPRKTKDSLEHGFCLRDKLNIPHGQRYELCRSIHAEQNAIIQAAYHGIRIQGATLYCTNLHCVICTKMLINAGIKEIIYESGYADDLSREMLLEARIPVRQFAQK